MESEIRFKYEEFKEDPIAIALSFKRNGIVHIDNIFTEDLCVEAINSLIECEKNLSINMNNVGLVTETIDNNIFIKYYQGLFSVDRVFRKFFSSRLIDIAKNLLDVDDLYFSDIETHIRNPGGSVIPKHQDNFYFNLKEAKGVTCYIALNHHDNSLGALNYLLQSHVKRVVPHSPSNEAGFSSEILDSTVDKKGLSKHSLYQPSYIPGSVTFHHPENIHFANAVKKGFNRAFALSVRIFSNSEIIDEEGLKNYQNLLAMNRN